MASIAGELRLDGERLAVRIERRYVATTREVWDAISTPERLRRWFAEVSGDLRQGGEFGVVFGEGDDNVSHGRVIDCQPPSRLEVTWSFGAGADDSILVAELASEDEHTILTLDHRGIPTDQIGYGAGWEAYLDRLDAHMGGGQLGDWWEATSRLIPAYSAAAAALDADREH
ncbi:SRPBCC family protein [Phytoactinopolyspora alkaliphila]|uniref:SRPBCC family protein n=1 Tax=Phytoactinopolyspora alkaliphila TaxID=1783498 RepID=A0A6N9YI87_9ACTN|nr:SRPBCC family protein [Phytoactinopolyspora alkaliphila]NED94713.1 SRPBCC family protein [Phytoactinopolyspora alkaliphila]